jgi:5'-nucleotidase (lipoprotein e(P4) family)
VLLTMKKIYNCLPVIIILFVVSCSSSKKVADTSIVNDGKVWASLWQQQAAEYKALCFQAYNIAALRLDDAVKQPTAKPFAVITDIDETLLDNSPYDAQKAVNNLGYDSKSWKTWTAKGIADTVPGAPAFFKHAAQKGVEVFYITNRDEDERAGTLKNLALYGLPNDDDAHLIMRHTGSSKESRRQDVLKTHNVILLCGDNLADFDALYDNKPSEQSRTEATRQLIQQFGSRYIVLPNPEYGDWESSLFNFNYKLTNAQKDSVIKSQLKLDK